MMQANVTSKQRPLVLLCLTLKL